MIWCELDLFECLWVAPPQTNCSFPSNADSHSTASNEKMTNEIFKQTLKEFLLKWRMFISFRVEFIFIASEKERNDWSRISDDTLNSSPDRWKIRNNCTSLTKLKLISRKLTQGNFFREASSEIPFCMPRIPLISIYDAILCTPLRSSCRNGGWSFLFVVTAIKNGGSINHAAKPYQMASIHHKPLCLLHMHREAYIRSRTISASHVIGR